MRNKVQTTLINSFFIALVATFGCSKEELEPVDAKQEVASAATADVGNPKVTLRSKHYIIISSGDKLPANLENQAESANGKITSLLSEAGVATAVSEDPDFAAKAAKISGVRSVVRDFSYQGFDPEKEKTIALEADNINPPSSGDDDKLFPLQWGHTAIQAPEAWNAGARGQNAKVAVLDSGFDLTHPDLKDNIIVSESFVPNEPAQFQGAGFSHGTHTAGTVAAVDNTMGVIGVAPDAKLILVKVLADKGSGSFSWMINGIYYAVTQQADVINMSLGAALPRNGKYLDDNGTPDNPADDFIVNDTKATQELIIAINKVTNFATKKGVTVIASAGNDANNGNKDQSLMHIPSGATNVISISATGPLGWALNPNTDLDRFASYSNYGTADVDFAAPGGDFMLPGNEIVVFRGVRQYAWALDMVLSTSSNGRYTWSAGTSMASPHVAGVAALIIGKNGGQMDPTRVEAALRASADDLGKSGQDPYYGHGRVNAYRAVTSGL